MKVDKYRASIGPRLTPYKKGEERDRIDVSFESTWEYISYLESFGTSPISGAATSSLRPPGDWSGGVNLNGALALARDGWIGPVPDIKITKDNIVKRIAERIETTVQFTTAPAGGCFIPGRFYAGDPRDMIRPVLIEAPKHGKVLTVLVAGVASSGVSADQLINRGKALASLAAVLERFGFRLAITLDMGQSVNTAKHKYFSCHIPIKKATEPLDLPKLSYWLAHPSVLRRLFFRFQETAAKIDKSFVTSTKHGYGCFPFIANDHRTDHRPADIYLNGMEWGNFESTSTIESWIVANLVKVEILTPEAATALLDSLKDGKGKG